MKIYHIKKTGHDGNAGTEEAPFLTINRAASIAMPGDRVVVHEGVYREWVKPKNGGLGEDSRIIYMAAAGEHVVIKGSEHIADWQVYEDNVWCVKISNDFFGEYNPYREALWGDWFLMPEQYPVHTGDVYLNGRSFYEAASIEEVKKAEIVEFVNLDGKGYHEKRLYPEDSRYKWYAEVDEECTVIYANFHGANPNEELVEINVRKCCFYPEEVGRDYITVSGFEMAHAATPFTPPTADQPGLIGPNWSKGWIIENNIIHDSKCSGISLGKEMSTGHNEHALHHVKPGFQGQIESVFRALKSGWKKETIGSHIVRNNQIYDCGQNGIVGHMGCIFSEIYGNEIYHIGVKYEFFGWEIAGIKFHAPIDVMIRNNHIHHCYLGLWLDWQTQGTRVSCNLLHDNPRDCVVEVSHGPFLMDNNIFASKNCINLLAQGGAFVHNLILGSVNWGKVLDRSTPYHFPHDTMVAGCSLVYGADDRWYNNLFICEEESKQNNKGFGTQKYEECPTSLQEYVEKVKALGNEDIEKYVKVEQPAYIDGNAYYGAARGCALEQHSYTNQDMKQRAKLVFEEGKIYIDLDLEEGMLDVECRIQTTETLSKVRIVDAKFESYEGKPISIDYDFYGNKRQSRPVAGPFEGVRVGVNRMEIIF